MGMIVLGMVLVWCALGGVIYWALVSGSASMGEEVKFKVVADDEPVVTMTAAGGANHGGRKAGRP